MRLLATLRLTFLLRAESNFNHTFKSQTQELDIDSLRSFRLHGTLT